MVKGIILQTRDFDILSSVYEYTVCSFEQIKTKHFATINQQTASNRLSHLVKAQYLKRYTVGLVIYQGKERRVNRVFTITQKGIDALAVKRREFILRSDPVTPQFYSLVHDLLLNDVQESLKRTLGTGKVVNAKLLKLSASRTEQIPDLILAGASGELSEAIELELTAKSEKRYREILTNYRLSSKWKKVIFIVQDVQLAAKLWQILTGEKHFQALPKYQTGKFQILLLDDFIAQSQPTECDFKSQERHFMPPLSDTFKNINEQLNQHKGDI